MEGLAGADMVLIDVMVFRKKECVPSNNEAEVIPSVIDGCVSH